MYQDDTIHPVGSFIGNSLWLWSFGAQSASQLGQSAGAGIN
jgi:hypothetical protein